ncbi:molybdenum ABC transporter ATP-binding protein [Roseovarius autotrophicus]|uniref:molybdenum ABC transporter ATP-binding protein n=1 Tax=Roseovarius autotrophicus TaxID=2824121 RepID=UPI0019DDA8ED|nr:molybdenum ABC transporter ATP-binding protein [Roseovarius autotrophicus]MBE0453800.1 molybdenum ABC transporter ATP-binding protein [Roseovarius sp.]
MTLSVDIRVAFPEFALSVAQDFAGAGITAVFGPSGCGKSTLLRVIAGFERGATGRISFGPEVWMEGRRQVAPHRRGVGYVFQDARLFPHLTARGNLDYAERRAPGGPSAYSFDDVVEVLDLAPLFGRRATQLSGGERQRVAIGRTLLARPRLLLMDEPLAALDTRRKGEILPYIARLQSAFGLPILYVTHALEEVTQLCDRIVALAAGRVVAAGGVSEVLERLDLADVQGRFEAGAIVAGRIVAHDPELHLSRIDLGRAMLEVPAISLPEGSEVRLRIRARDVSLALGRLEGLSIRNQLSARVLRITEEAGTAFAEVVLNVAGQHLRARLTRAALRDLALAEGQPVTALVKAVAFDRQALPRPARAGVAGDDAEP